MWLGPAEPRCRADLSGRLPDFTPFAVPDQRTRTQASALAAVTAELDSHRRCLAWPGSAATSACF